MTLREEVARETAEWLGDSFDDALLNKAEWIKWCGVGPVTSRFRDVNEPYQSDYLSAADAILPLILSKAAEVARTIVGDRGDVIERERIARQIEMLGEG